MARTPGRGRRTPSAAGQHGRRGDGNREEPAPPTRNRAAAASEPNTEPNAEPNEEPNTEPEPEPELPAGNDDYAPQAYRNAKAKGGKKAPRKPWSQQGRPNQRKWEAKERKQEEARKEEEEERKIRERKNHCQRIRRQGEKAAAKAKAEAEAAADDDDDEALQLMLGLSIREAAGRNGPSGVGIGGSGDGAAGVEAETGGAPDLRPRRVSESTAHHTVGGNNPGSIPEQVMGVLQTDALAAEARTHLLARIMSSPERQGSGSDDDGEDDRKLAPGEKPRSNK